MKIKLLIVAIAVIFSGCKNNAGEADAFGNFEADEVIVSSETSGRILQFAMEEGAHVGKGEIIAIVDTVIPHLQKAEIDAGMNSIRTRLTSLTAQNEILNQQIENIRINIARIENMLKDNAATQKQHDDLTGQVKVLYKQIAANNTQKVSVASELAVYEARKATLNEQITRSSVRSPLKGSIIEKYSEAGETTAPGKPLAKIADLSLIRLKVYVSGAQIGRIGTGQECTVRIDEGQKGYRTVNGVISHVAEKAEFTPKIIQTREERVTLVYAVTINVVNDGTLKSGMPGEAIF